MMTVGELHRALGAAIELGLEDSELRIAHQPHWPLQEYVEGVWFDDEVVEDFQETDGSGDPPLFYIASGGQDHDSPYAPKAAMTDCVDYL